MHTTRRTRLALTGAALVSGLALAAPAHAQPQSPASSAGGSCTVRLTYGSAVASYSSQSGVFGTTTHVSLSSTGDAYRLISNRLHIPGARAVRGITGTVITPRGWTVQHGYMPAGVWLSVGIVDVNTGRYGTCRTR